MNSSALVVMLVAMVLIWGGLIFSVIHLVKNPDIDIGKIPNDD
ncbi:methionine/alanine import family NSS transporter small subunit [Moraxella oblonga]|nr:methionine/alanine import family NSS transporter small subunit [Moraxella oblonga]